MIKKQNVEVTLLSKEEVEGKSKVLQKVGIKCDENYWTRTTSYFNPYDPIDEYYVVSSSDQKDFINCTYGCRTIDICGVRPIVKHNNLEELIGGLIITDIALQGSYTSVEEVKFDHYPDLDKKICLHDNVNLKPTGKKYYYPLRNSNGEFILHEYPEYEYNGEIIVNIENNYYPVKQLEFYIDRENSMLISKGVLFSSPINIDKKDYNGDFETSQLYQFLNNEFIKTLMSENINDKDVLDTEIESQISNKENKGHQKTYHL